MDKYDKKQYQQIGDRIRKARQEDGLTQAQLAKKLNYNSATAISLIESGERKVRMDHLKNIAKVLHRPVSYFYEGKIKNAPDVKMALRADKKLNPNDVGKIEEYIDLLKQSKRRQDGRENRK